MQLGGERREVAVLFVDVIGSTAVAVETEPEEVVHRLNAFFGVVVEVVTRHHGWVNKFEGDAALAAAGPEAQTWQQDGEALLRGRSRLTRLARPR